MSVDHRQSFRRRYSFTLHLNVWRFYELERSLKKLAARNSTAGLHKTGNCGEWCLVLDAAGDFLAGNCGRWSCGHRFECEWRHGAQAFVGELLEIESDRWWKCNWYVYVNAETYRRWLRLWSSVPGPMMRNARRWMLSGRARWQGAATIQTSGAYSKMGRTNPLYTVRRPCRER